jgi:hypothetical protein
MTFARSSISSSDDALHCVSELQAKVSAWSKARRTVSPDEVSEVETMLADLKGYLLLSRQSEAVLRERLSNLERELSTIRTELMAATDTIAGLDRRLVAATGTITDLQHRLVAVEQRDKPITVREAMRELEKRVCLEAAGSNTAARRLYCFSRFSAPTDQASLASVMALRGLTEDCVNALGYMKDLGDTAAHDARPIMPVPDWEGLLEAALRGSPFDGDANIPAALLGALKSYAPPPADPAAPWILTAFKLVFQGYTVTCG